MECREIKNLTKVRLPGGGMLGLDLRPLASTFVTSTIMNTEEVGWTPSWSGRTQIIVLLIELGQRSQRRRRDEGGGGMGRSARP